LPEPYEVNVDDRALKEFKKLAKGDQKIATLITNALRLLATDRKTTVKRLSGVKPSLYRKRVENFRIVFAQSAKRREIFVLTIRKRDDDTYDQRELEKFSAGLDSDFDG